MVRQSKRRQIFDLWEIPLFIPTQILIFTLFLTSCNSTSDNSNNSSSLSPDSIHSSEMQNASLDSVVHWLLDASAKDFHDHQPPVPVGFRNVQIRYLMAPDVEKQYMICGQFLSQDKQDKDEWIPFATIKTSEYEQWIGTHSLVYCQDSKVIPYKITDLSFALKNRVDSLHNLQDLTK